MHQTIREYGKIWNLADFKGEEVNNSFDEIFILKKDFEALAQFIESELDQHSERAFQIGRKGGKSFIRVKNFVGIIEAKSGWSIEILPKIYGLSIQEEGEVVACRRLFLRMLRCLKDSPFLQIKEAHIKAAKFPILEVFIRSFIEETQRLIQQGIRKNYVNQIENSRFLKGKILVAQNLQKNSIRNDRFYVSYDDYSINSAHNRLVKTCLEKLKRSTQSSKNRDQINQLLLHFETVPLSTKIDADFRRVLGSNRLYKNYTAVLNWAKVFLKNKSFTNFKGRSLNQALLFPMERIFEDYVGHQFQKHLDDVEIRLQDKRHHLIADHLGSKKFNLRPDLVIEASNHLHIIDMKWKLINQDSSTKNYGISQSDMYQLFGYGEKYKREEKQTTLVLIYPYHQQFTQNLPPFHYYNEGLTLYVVPFNLGNDEIKKEVSKIMGVAKLDPITFNKNNPI